MYTNCLDQAIQKYETIEGLRQEVHADMQSLEISGSNTSVSAAVSICGTLNSLANRLSSSYATAKAHAMADKIEDTLTTYENNVVIGMHCWNGDDGKYENPHGENFGDGTDDQYVCYRDSLNVLNLSTVINTYGGSMQNVENARNSDDYIYGDIDWTEHDSDYGEIHPGTGTTLVGFENRSPSHRTQYYVVNPENGFGSMAAEAALQSYLDSGF